MAKKRKIAGKVFELAEPDKQRSRTMSKIKSSNTSIERIMARALRENGIKYRKGAKIYGSPDFRIFGHKIVVFCDGDFWHGYKGAKKTKTNSGFWKAKIERNMERDSQVNLELKKRGWKVLRFWEHDIKNRVDKCISRLKKLLDKEIKQKELG